MKIFDEKLKYFVTELNSSVAIQESWRLIIAKKRKENKIKNQRTIRIQYKQIFICLEY